MSVQHLKQVCRLLTNLPLSYKWLPCLSLTRGRRAWMEERFRPSHCLICLGKALTSNTNLNDNSGNLGSVSEARLGLARWPSPGKHGKFAGSICHSQHELWKRTRREWLNGLDLRLPLVDVRMNTALIVLWDYRKLYQAQTRSSWTQQWRDKKDILYLHGTNILSFRGDWVLFCGSGEASDTPGSVGRSDDAAGWEHIPVQWTSLLCWHKQLIILKLDIS